MLTLEDVLRGSGGRLVEPASTATVFSNVVTDSRAATPGSLFVALVGERSDGHNFVGDAVARGATGAMICRGVECNVATAPVLVQVEDTLAALQRLGHYWRCQFPAVEVIGVTGSVGKTSTKELITQVLSQRFHTYRNPGNLNGEIGLPVALLGLDAHHQKAVLEMAMYRPGEIALQARLAQPRLGVVTNVYPSHLQRLGSIEAITAAKRELVEALPGDGVAILNGDDPRVRGMAVQAAGRVFLYGTDPAFDLWASEIDSQGLEGVQFRLHHGKESLSLRIPLLGQHSVHTALAATAVALVEGLSWEEIVAGLANVPEQVRLIVVPGKNGATLLDDTYNASPASCLAALNLLAEIDGRKIAVLGDMYELGSYEVEGHKVVGGRAGAVAHMVIGVGKLGRLIADEAGVGGHAQVHHVATNTEAVAWLLPRLQPGDFVLIKGSRGMHMEEIVEALRAPGNGNGNTGNGEPRVEAQL